MAELVLSKVWFLFIADTVVVDVGPPDNGFVGIRGLSLDRLCTLFHVCWKKQRSVRNERLTGQTRNMTMRVCLNRSVFLLFSLSCELSPFLLHEHVLSLLVSKLCILSLHSLYKFHVSCFVFSHFNSLPPASLSLLLHFNCDFHGYLTRSRSTCIKCPSGVNLLVRKH